MTEKFEKPPKPREPLPEGWEWVYSIGEWLPTHKWSGMNTQNAGEAWQAEANGRMGPHEDSSKVNLAPKDDADTLREYLGTIEGICQEACEWAEHTK
jgi:hypothetical protein